MRACIAIGPNLSHFLTPSQASGEDENGEMVESPVTVGVSNGNYVEIKDGIEPGETVYKIAEKEEDGAYTVVLRLVSFNDSDDPDNPDDPDDPDNKEHMGAFYDDGDALIVDQINWPMNTHWQNEPPTVDDVIENWGVIVTIIDNFARFDKF